MPVPDLIKTEREIIRALSRATAELAGIESESSTRLKRIQEKSESDFNELRTQADIKLKNTDKLRESADKIFGDKVPKHIALAESYPVNSGQSSGPMEELNCSVVRGQEALGKIISWHNDASMLFASVITFILGLVITSIIASSHNTIAVTVALLSTTVLASLFLFRASRGDLNKKAYTGLLQSISDAQYWHTRYLQEARETYQWRLETIRAEVQRALES